MGYTSRRNKKNREEVGERGRVEGAVSAGRHRASGTERAAPSERHRASGTERPARQHRGASPSHHRATATPSPAFPEQPSKPDKRNQASSTNGGRHAHHRQAAEVTNNLFKQAFVITLEARVAYVRRYERLAHDRRATAAASGRWRSSRACRTRAAATRSSRTTT